MVCAPRRGARGPSSGVEACRGAVTPRGEYATDRSSLFSDIAEEPQSSTVLRLQSHQKRIRHEVRPHEFASQA